MKQLLWVGSSKKDLLEMPKKVISDIGHGLLEAQRGEEPASGKTLTGFGGRDVVELVSMIEVELFEPCTHCAIPMQ